MLVCTVVAVLMSAPDVGGLVLLGTLGLGFPLFFAATGVLYGLCAAPAIALWNNGSADRTVGVLVTAILVAIVALVPNALGRRTADARAKSLLASDYVTIPAARPQTIEIRVPSQGNSGWFGGPCATECHALLQSGQAQWIRFVKSGSDYGRPSGSSTFLRALRGKACAVPGATPSDTAVCAVVATDPGDAADLVVDLTGAPTEVEAVRPWHFSSIVSRRVVVAQTRNAGQLTETLRQTEVTTEAVGRPTLVAPQGHGMHSGGTDFLRQTYTVNPLTLAGVLTRLGYALDPSVDARPTLESLRAKMDAPIDDAMTREMISVLDLPGATPFDRDQMAPITTWMRHAVNVRVWTPELIALLRHIVRDRRVRSPTPFDGLFSFKPEIAKALLPDVLDMIEADGIGRDYTPARQAAYRFEQIDEGLLTPHAGRIVALLDKGPEVRAILLPAIGRIGVDPLPYLTPLLDDLTSPSHYSKDPRVIGACRADARWAPALIEALRAAYREVPGPQYDEVNYRGLVLKALTNLGDRDFVERELATNAKDDWLRRQIASAASEKKPADWLCRW